MVIRYGNDDLFGEEEEVCVFGLCNGLIALRVIECDCRTVDRKHMICARNWFLACSRDV